MSVEPTEPESSPAPEAAYAAPATPALETEALVRPSREGHRLLMFLIGLSTLPTACIAGVAGRSMWAAALPLGISLFVAGRRSVQAYLDAARDRDAGGTGTPIRVVFTGALFYALGAIVTLFFTPFFIRGRQVRRWGRSQLPALAEGGDWTGSTIPAQAAPELREPLADYWRATGQTEYASVGAFARLTLDLMALGAPPALVRTAQNDALDEIRHAELCFSVARTLDGRARSPGRFPKVYPSPRLPLPRPLALAVVAVESLIDGALHEGISARLISATLRRCEDPAIREMLRGILSDEGRHAAHGWRVVEWCVEMGGAPVAWALLGCLRMIPREAPSRLPEGAEAGEWERYGVPGRATEVEQRAKGREDVARRVRGLMAATDGVRVQAAA